MMKLDDIANDSRLAMESLSDFGVLCYDDFFNPEWPEVTLGIFNFLETQMGMQPVAITEKKIYICNKDHHRFYCDLITESPLMAKTPKTQIAFKNHVCLMLKEDIRRRVAYEVLRRAGLTRISGHFY